MAVDLSDAEFIDSLKREVIPLGSTLFADVADSDWLGYMTDAFWEARLDGFLTGYVTDSDGIVTNEAGGSDLDQKYIALIVLYAGIRILRNRILSTTTSTSFRAKAGPVEFEQENQNSATVLAEMLKQLRATKDRIIDELDQVGDPSSVLMLDAFSVRLFESTSYWGSPELTG